MASDGEEFAIRSNGGDWLTAWHSPFAVPAGTPHGANALCVTADDQVVLISNDGVRWGWPGGRPRVMSLGSRLSAGRSGKRRARLCVARGSSGFAEVCASVARRRIASWCAPYGGQKSSCCHGSQVSRSRIDELFP